jgi:4'-phosphopantetheinyl transferase
MSIEREIDFSSEWRPPPPERELGCLEVHVWIADLNIGSEHTWGLHSTLAIEERERAARFRFEKDRNHYIAGRGFLRHILSSYLKVIPSEVRFAYNDYGKPFLASGFAENKLRFNVGHSSGLALFGISSGREIGVDIERIRPDFATNDIADRFFAPEEVKELSLCDPAERPEAFFDCWTRKEAFVKARGMGLSLPLDQFVVAFGRKAPAALLTAKADPEASSRWLIRELPTPEGYAGAVALEASEVDLRLWRFDPRTAT